MKCVLRRDKEQEEKNTTSMNDNTYLSMLMATKDKSEDMMDLYNERQQKLNDTITLGYLLQTLDGIKCADNRIIVATTNYPERIDSALLRPGRFGLSIHLKNCNKQILTEIIGMIYQTTITLDDVKDIPDYKWSPVQVMQQGIMESDHESLIQKLIHGNPVEFG
jgi:SpoVK/Ycf46/Vps4 family AAA+-type ATPase